MSATCAGGTGAHTQQGIVFGLFIRLLLVSFSVVFAADRHADVAHSPHFAILSTMLSLPPCIRYAKALSHTRIPYMGTALKRIKRLYDEVDMNAFVMDRAALRIY